MRFFANHRGWYAKALLASAGALRSAVAIMAVLALSLQLIGVNAAQASSGNWIEICSDFGVSYVQMDSDGNAIAKSGSPDESTDCPDCADCVNCATVAFDLLAVNGTQQLQLEMQAMQVSLGPQFSGLWSKHAWPETRGPPTVNKEKTARALCAIMADSLFNGGAL
ncbi:hypothetical protein [Aliiroseovarius marinus]|uniref:hypothetical protein n=1 Tax=Aliiroseovarius marinus TaxID=2500159 RepID=UPI003D7D2687